MNDKDFFNQFPARQARIRRPERVLRKTTQRSVHYTDEFETEFRTLGKHQRDQRWVIVWRVPSDNPGFDPDKPPLVPIPYLAAHGYLIEDSDEFLLPMIHRLMMDAAGQ